jgi:hypothetical protein
MKRKTTLTPTSTSFYVFSRLDACRQHNIFVPESSDPQNGIITAWQPPCIRTSHRQLGGKQSLVNVLVVDVQMLA